MNDIIVQIRQGFAAYGPNLVAGLAILIVGWLIALALSSLVRKILGKVSLDNKIASWMAGPGSKESIPIEHYAARAVFLLVMLVVVIAFLQTIRLTAVTDPLYDLVRPVIAYLPRLFGAAILVFIAWVVATVLKKLLLAVLGRARVDERLGGATQTGGQPVALSATFAEVVYWLIFLLFLPPILQALDMQALLLPVTNLLNKAFTFLPNILSAAVILLVGWFVARIVQRILQSLLSSVGLDRVSEKWGLGSSLGQQKLSGILSQIVFILILVPVIISALGALQLEAITRPASDMLNKFMAALPNVIGAGLIICLAWFVGKVVASLLTNLLEAFGFNNILAKLGLARTLPQPGQSPARIVGRAVQVLIVLLASATACEMLGFERISVLIRDFIVFAGHILVALVIFALGLMLAQVVTNAILASASLNARRLAFLARVVILALAGAMALRQTGLADEIVNLAFGLTLGAVAIATAIAFGLGGRDIAAETLREWRSEQKKGF